jgi:Protein of unknown function (DUF1761)
MWNFHWYEVLAAAIAGFAIGGLWYGPLFGKLWQRESGLSDEALRDANMVLIFAGTFLLNLVSASLLGHLFSASGNPGLRVSLMIASGIGAGFVGTSIGVNYLFARKSVKLFLIDAGYWLVIYTVMGAIFGILD